MIAAMLGMYIAVSQDIAQKLKRVFRVPDKKLQIIHPSVNSLQYTDASNLDPPAEIEHLGEQPIILTVARLDRQKGLPTLLEAAAQVPEAVFVIVGEGPERSTLEAQSRDLGR
jgi:glycosyltransferase involved in cell wall biosynthesis